MWAPQFMILHQGGAFMAVFVLEHKQFGEAKTQ